MDLMDNISPLVQVMAWHWIGKKPLPESKWPRSLATYGITRSQWVKILILYWKSYIPPEHIDGLVQDCNNSTVNALELLQFCPKPKICNWASCLLHQPIIMHAHYDLHGNSTSHLSHEDQGTFLQTEIKSEYHQISNISRTLVGNQIVWSLRCSWSIAYRRCSNYIFILDWTHGFNGLGKDNCKTGQETFKVLGFGALILEVWQ